MHLKRFLAQAATLTVAFAGPAFGEPGELDPAFGAAGTANTTGSERGHHIAVHPDGKFFVGGGEGTASIARFRPNGTPDPEFGGNAEGRVTLGSGTVGGIAVLRHGRVVAGVSSQAQAFLHRLHIDGFPDSTLGGTGVVQLPFPAPSFIEGVLLLPDERTIAWGAYAGQLVLARVLYDGQVDPTFGIAGLVVSATVGGTAQVILLPDGKLLVAGRKLGADALLLTRLNADGSPDASFQEATIASALLAGLVVQRDGRILLQTRGETVAQLRVGRLRRFEANGAPDLAFGGGQGVVNFPLGVGTEPMTLTLQPDGKLLVTGLTSFGGTDSFVARLRAEASIDISFTTPASPLPGMVVRPTSQLQRNAVHPEGRLLVTESRPGEFAVLGYDLMTAEQRAPGDSDGDAMPNAAEFEEGRDVAVKDNDIFTDARLFARQQYRDFLGREGDTGGVAFWAGQLDGGAQTRTAMVQTFFDSAEFQGLAAPVARLYFASFLRAPDDAGLRYWMAQYRSHGALNVIANQFAQSPEFLNRYGLLDNAQFVTLVYRNVLGREPDAAGLAFWTGELDGNARTRGQVMEAFSESPEYRALTDNEVYVSMMYVGMLRRQPDSGGFDFWVGVMDAGQSGQGLVAQFLAAPEYRNRFLP